jgi:hypothetical protein
MRSAAVQKRIDEARARASPRHVNPGPFPARLGLVQILPQQLAGWLNGFLRPAVVPPAVRLIGWTLAADLDPPNLTLVLESPEFPEVAPGAPIPTRVLDWDALPARPDPAPSSSRIRPEPINASR